MDTVLVSVEPLALKEATITQSWASWRDWESRGSGSGAWELLR